MSDSQASTPLPNDPAARTPTGEIKDAQAPTNSDSTPSPNPNPTEPKSDAKPDAPADPAKPASPAGPPDEYKFTPPEGKTFDKALLDAATPVFRELGLTQAQADKLVALQQGLVVDKVAALNTIIAEQGAKWETQLKADPDLGPRLETIKTDAGRAFAALAADPAIGPKVVEDFKFAMNSSMVGSNPAFVKIFDKLFAPLLEGKPVPGGKPSPLGQSPSGRVTAPSAAAAMYPNLAASTH